MKLWVLGFVGLLASVLFGLCWSVFQSDFEAGFIIIACITMLLTFSVRVM